MGEVLVAHLLGDLGGRQKNWCAELVARAGEHELVEIGERDDEVDAVLFDELCQLGHVAGVVDPYDELVAVRVVERRSEAVDVRCDRGRTRPAEGRDDVHALPGAGEEDRRHGERA